MTWNQFKLEIDRQLDEKDISPNLEIQNIDIYYDKLIDVTIRLFTDPQSGKQYIEIAQ